MASTGATHSSSPTQAQAPSLGQRVGNTARRMSQEFAHGDVPLGFMAAAGDIGSSITTTAAEAQESTRGTNQIVTGPSSPERSPHSGDPAAGEHSTYKETIAEERNQPTAGPSKMDLAQAGNSSTHEADAKRLHTPGESSIERVESGVAEEKKAAGNQEPFANGYHFPPSYTRKESTIHFLKASLRYITTPLGLFVVIYGLNVVAWGGMLFLLLCNASPAMCYPTCNDINSPRRVWVEYDSQVLTALFSLTGFGLAPWRFRDLYYLLKWRVFKKPIGLRQLAAVHRKWIRLPGSQQIPLDVSPSNIEARVGEPNIPESAVPSPITKISTPPLSGTRAAPTVPWHIDYAIWCNIWNTFFQAVLSGIMWGMNRFDRPSWSTGLFVAFGCISAAAGGIMMGQEGKKVKKTEGVPLTEEDLARLRRDEEAGLMHYNNLGDKPPKEDKQKAKDRKKVAKTSASGT